MKKESMILSNVSRSFFLDTPAPHTQPIPSQSQSLTSVDDAKQVRRTHYSGPSSGMDKNVNTMKIYIRFLFSLFTNIVLAL